MKIKNISIENIGGIEELNLEFNDKMNIICGTNGIGKTTILECISHFFVSNSISDLKRNAKSKIGNVKGKFNFDNRDIELDYKVEDFEPDRESYVSTKLYNNNKKIIVFNALRNFNYIKLNEIYRDEDRKTYHNQQLIHNGIDAESIKKWFCNRYMFKPHKDGLNEKQEFNLEKAIEMFSIMDQNVKFARLKPDTFDIMLDTNQGEIYFEYLSSGYKSSIHILLGIIKEIEYRFKEPYIKVDEFDGIVLIDEVEVHLHPQWQAQLVKALRKLLPNAQIIITTHSPSVIQTAEHNEVIALYYNEEGRICIKDLEESKYEFQGWTIEEILQDIMGMEDTTSKLFKETLQKFDMAVDEEDGKTARECYKILNEMLHPQNHLRKILQIEQVGLGDHYDKNK